MSASHIILIDASGYAHAAYHAGAKSYSAERNGEAIPTGAIIGFMGMIYRLLGEARADFPTHGAAVFDAPGLTFRHKLYKKYKANRTKNEELAVQLPIMRTVSHVLGLETVELEGFEGDDVLATLARRARAEGMRVTIVSRDKDLCQCVRAEPPEVEIVDPFERVRRCVPEVIDKFGVPPVQVPDIQALTGDTVDNIPGIPNIGAKKAGALVRKFGSLDAILHAVDHPPSGYIWDPNVRVALRRNAADLKLWRKLTTLRDDVPLAITFDELPLRTIDPEHIKALLKALGAGHRYEVLFTRDRKLWRTVEALPANVKPDAWWREELKFPGQRPPNEPQCGYYQRRLVRGGPTVPVRIWREPEVDFVTNQPTGNDTLCCEVLTDRKDALDQWDYVASAPITKADYDAKMKRYRDARSGATKDPIASPREKIDPRSIPTPVFKRKKAKT